MKTNYILFYIVTLLLLLSSPTMGDDSDKFDYITHKEFFRVPALPKPARGVIMTDPFLHTKFTRITDKVEDDYLGKAIVNEYSRVDPENCNGTRVLLMSVRGGKHWYLYDPHTRSFVKKLKIVGEIEPRWDANSPHIFYYVAGMKLCMYNVLDDTRTLVRDFKGDYFEGHHIRSRYEGTPSSDSRYWAFRVDAGRDWKPIAIICYDMQKDKIVGEWKNPPGNDHVTMSRSGKYVVVAQGDGHFAYNRDFSRSVKLSPTPAHGDVALDEAGRDVFVYQNTKNDWIEMTDMETGKTTKLLYYPHGPRGSPWPGLHFSGTCSKVPGWVIVATCNYDIFCWADLSIFTVELKENPIIWRIVYTHTRRKKGQKDYWAEAFAAINGAGTRIYWASNWDMPGGPIDVYCAYLPDNWYNELKLSN